MISIEEIKKFIQGFKNFGTGEQIIDCFSNGNCFWFSYILKARFPYGEICYFPIYNHFVYKAFNRIFDITGDCTTNYDTSQMISWSEYQIKELGSSHLDRLIDDCILKK